VAYLRCDRKAGLGRDKLRTLGQSQANQLEDGITIGDGRE